MSGWLLSIAGIVIVGALVDVLLTDSPMSRFIRGIFGFFVLLVIVAPLPGLIDDGIKAVSGDIQLNTELLQTINAQTANAFQRNTESALSAAGFRNVIVTIEHDPNAMGFVITRVFVNAFDVVLTNNVQAINIKAEIIRIVMAVCNVDQGRIFYVG